MEITKYFTQWKYRVHILKTLYFNFKYLSLREAIKFPYLIGCNVIFRTLKGSVQIDAPIKRGMIRIGFRDMGIQNEKDQKTILDLRAESQLIFKGCASIGAGARIYTKGILTIGDDFYLSLNSTIIAHENVSFSKSCTVGWDSLIMDTDFHKVYNFYTGEKYPMTKPILIGEHVWICNECQILKGAVIPDDTIIASKSLINSALNTPPFACRRMSCTFEKRRGNT